ncbi:MAG: hypothetical protein IJR45_08680 [Firmicutes bacterium]|nr:hypothetical protein [Bacillota bacterium]
MFVIPVEPELFYFSFVMVGLWFTLASTANTDSFFIPLQEITPLPRETLRKFIGTIGVVLLVVNSCFLLREWNIF